MMYFGGFVVDQRFRTIMGGMRNLCYTGSARGIQTYERLAMVNLRRLKLAIIKGRNSEEAANIFDDKEREKEHLESKLLAGRWPLAAGLTGVHPAPGRELLGGDNKSCTVYRVQL